jgi:hypothetical protein
MLYTCCTSVLRLLLGPLLCHRPFRHRDIVSLVLRTFRWRFRWQRSPFQCPCSCAGSAVAGSRSNGGAGR